MSYKIGDRVRVQIARPETWHRGAVESLNGALGTVEELSTNCWGLTVLVRFDEPQAPWHAHQRLQEAHWFGPEDLFPVVSHG